MAMLTDEARKAYERALREKEEAFIRKIYPPVIVTPARGGGKTATLMEMQERYHQPQREDMLQRRRMEAERYMSTMDRPWYSYPSNEEPPQRTFSQQEVDFIKREYLARGKAEQRENNDQLMAGAFERGRAYVEPTPKAPLPIHNAMRVMLHADERYANKAFLPGGLLAYEE